MFLKWRNLGKIHIIVINKIKSIFIENILVILFITVSIFFLIPVVSALMAWFFLNETLTSIDILGFLIASFGVYVATQNK